MALFSARNHRFTRYDLMEATGIFAANPANVDSGQDPEGNNLYRGPVEYPKMFYHPEGQQRVIVQAQALTDSAGNPILDRNGEMILRGEQREIIWELARSPEDEERLLTAGWHDHPAKAIAAGGGIAPPTSSNQRIEDLESQIKRLQAELEKGKPRAVTVKSTQTL